MKRFVLLLLLAIFCSALSAQQKLSFSVLEFEQDVFDTSAKSSEYGKKDGNGSWYAIIKVKSNNPDDDISACQFNFGNMSSKVERHNDALWIYVQRNAKTVTISRPGYYTIDKYDLQTTIEAGAVYKMVLTSDRVQHQVVFDVKMQMVKFQTSPVVQGIVVTATNQDTGEKISLGITGSNGAVSKALNYGRYTYEILSTDNMYLPSEGIITLNNSKDVMVENVVLRPNFADVSLVVENNAEIYLNEELKGISKWSGRLTPGKYIVTTKLDKHKDAQQQIVITEGKTETITLKSPTPITGTIVINTTPTDAQIYLDGKDYGVTPKILNDVIVGRHNLQMAMRGYNTERRDIIIEEGKVENVDVELQPISSKATSFSNNVSDGIGIENGYEYVDLGLPSGTLWATCNIGSETPEGCGEDYYWSHKEDIARKIWGGYWRLPVIDEIEELIKYCKTKFVTQNGVKGIKFTGSNGNSIFIPGANNVGEESIEYMSGTRHRSYANNGGVYTLQIEGRKAKRSEAWTSYKKRVRAVLSKIDYGTMGIENGHEYVDLGLPSGTLWATCNLGTYNSTDWGDLFAWGETTTKDSFDKENYRFKKYTETLSLENDAANALWGGRWRIPTSEEFKELLNNCTITHISSSEKHQFGWMVKGPNGNSIFIANTGRYSSTGNTVANRESIDEGYYWTSNIGSRWNHTGPITIYFKTRYENDNWILNIRDSVQPFEGYNGQAIRPVMTK